MMATSAPPLRRLRGVLSSLLVAGFLVTGLAGAAQAADGYRYWNYFHLQGRSWAFSQVGAGDYQPKDGGVEAYRFGTSASPDGLPPRADLSTVNFDAICGADEADADQKRVAVVLDYGTEADADGATPPAPRAECAVVAAGADGQQVIQAVADVRVEKGLTCALDGYPAAGCGEPVPDAKAATEEQAVAFELPAADPGSSQSQAASEEDSDSGLLWPLLGVAVVVVVIAGGALALTRRNRTS